MFEWEARVGKLVMAIGVGVVFVGAGLVLIYIVTESMSPGLQNPPFLLFFELVLIGLIIGIAGLLLSGLPSLRGVGFVARAERVEKVHVEGNPQGVEHSKIPMRLRYLIAIALFVGSTPLSLIPNPLLGLLALAVYIFGVSKILSATIGGISKEYTYVFAYPYGLVVSRVPDAVRRSRWKIFKAEEDRGLFIVKLGWRSYWSASLEVNLSELGNEGTRVKVLYETNGFFGWIGVRELTGRFVTALRTSLLSVKG